MKCINCQTENNLQDRTANQGRCKNCHHPFAFEPTAMEDLKLTDGFFDKVISDISVNNTLFFSQKQLLYFLDKKFKRKNYTSWINIIFFYLFFTSFLTTIIGIISFKVINLNGAALAALGISGFLIFSYEEETKFPYNSYGKRKQMTIGLMGIGSIVLLGGIGASLIILKSYLYGILSALLGIWSIYLGATSLRNKNNLPQILTVNSSKIGEWLDRWQETNGPINKIISVLPLATESTVINSEITNYSFDRLVVTDTAAVAQFLITNNFHFENNCAILSITGYPQEIFDTVLEMLKRNQDLKVYALHDATPTGVSLVYQLKSNERWFANSSATIYDLGILPRQVFKKAKISVFNSPDLAQEAKGLPKEVKETLSPEEIAWLELGNYVELESFTPAKLLQFLTKGIALSRSGDTDVLVSLDSYSSDVGYIFAVDSFG